MSLNRHQPTPYLTNLAWRSASVVVDRLAIRSVEPAGGGEYLPAIWPNVPKNGLCSSGPHATNRARPPVRSTSRILVSPAPKFAKNITPMWHVAASKDCAANGIPSALHRRYSMFVIALDRAFRCIASKKTGEGSVAHHLTSWANGLSNGQRRYSRPACDIDDPVAGCDVRGFDNQLRRVLMEAGYLLVRTENTVAICVSSHSSVTPICAPCSGAMPEWLIASPLPADRFARTVADRFNRSFSNATTIRAGPERWIASR